MGRSLPHAVAPAQTQVCCYYNKRLPAGGGKRTAEACTDCQKISPALGDAEALGDANESVHRVEVGRRMGGDVSKTLALDHLDGGRIVDDLRMKLRNQRLDTPKPPDVLLQQRTLSPLDVHLNQVHIGARGQLAQERVHADHRDDASARTNVSAVGVLMVVELCRPILRADSRLYRLLSPPSACRIAGGQDPHVDRMFALKPDKAKARSSGRDCRAERSPPTRCGSSFMRSPTTSAIEPRPLRRLPDGRGRHPGANVPGDSAADRGTAAAATTRARMRRSTVMRSRATDGMSASECQGKRPDQAVKHRSDARECRQSSTLSHLGFQPVQKTSTIHVSSGFIWGIPDKTSRASDKLPVLR